MISQAYFLIVSDDLDNRIAKVLSQQLKQQGNNVQFTTYKEISANEISAKVNYSHFIAILPETTNLEVNSFPLPQMVKRLQSIANPPNNTCIAYVQFGGGDCGSGVESKHPEVCCAAGFARSIHLERPDLQVQVIDLVSEIESNQAVDLILSELSKPEKLITVGYNANLKRQVYQAVLQQPIKYEKRSLNWSEDDVILVTGGGKGITAECAFALAKKTGVKMALIGRSTLENTEVSKTILRFQESRLTCNYYCCDITNLDGLTEVVELVTKELGLVTGIIHGAGLNKPRLVQQVSYQEAIAEVSPKLLGGYNLLKFFKATPPKLIMAFSSIIGVTGMPGNAWYAFANESLTLLLSCFEKQYPQTQTQALAYSVWGEIGMGAKMDSVKTLQRMGIDSIPTNEGVSRFLQLFEYDPKIKQVMIAARLGLDTWNPFILPPPSGFRFLEEVLYVETGVELKARTHLSLKKDPYLNDHLWRGSYLFPTVFGLEAMAQAGIYIAGETELSLVRIKDISLQRPIVVNPISGVKIEIYAEVMELNTHGEIEIKTTIRTEQTGFKIDHFSATLVLGKSKVGNHIKWNLGEALDIQPEKDLYGDLLFQGKRFQRMGNVFSLNHKDSVFSSFILPEKDLLAMSFAKNLGNKMVLGDPYFRDVLLQSVQLTIPQHICLPVQIDKIEFYQNFNQDQDKTSRIVSVVLQKRKDQEYIAEVITTDDQGNVIEKLIGYKLRILEEHPKNPTAEMLVHPESEDRRKFHQVANTTFEAFGLNKPALAIGYIPCLSQKSREQRHLLEKPIINLALKDKLNLSTKELIDFSFSSLPSGKPQITGSNVAGLDLSLSHCDHYCLCTIDSTPQGCDLESITHREIDDWIALLSRKHESLLKELVNEGETQDESGTRIWSSLEAVRKAFNEINKSQFYFVAKKGQGVLLKIETSNGNYGVITFPLKLIRPPQKMVAILVSFDKLSVLQTHNLKSSMASLINC